MSLKAIVSALISGFHKHTSTPLLLMTILFHRNNCAVETRRECLNQRAPYVLKRQTKGKGNERK